MLTDYFSCHKLNNKPKPFHEKKKSQQLFKLSNCQCYEYFGLFEYQCLLNSKLNKVTFYEFCFHLHSGKLSAYHTDSAFIQHYYACRT